MPESFDKKNEGKLWVAEKYLCEEAPFLIKENNPRRDMANYVAAYVGKWSPYNFYDIMQTYFLKNTDLKLEKEILRVYS